MSKEEKNESQKLMDLDGNVVDFLERKFEKEFYRIETDTHYIERMATTIDAKKDAVEKEMAKQRYKAADQIAEGFIRSATRAKPIYKKMKKKKYLESLLRSWSLFKEHIFNYGELTKEQLAADTTEEGKESTEQQ